MTNTVWEKVPQSLPPTIRNRVNSAGVWLALSDGRVVLGQACYGAHGLHDWFIGNRSIGAWLGVSVLAWTPLEVPAHPDSIEDRRTP